MTTIAENAGIVTVINVLTVNPSNQQKLLDILARAIHTSVRDLPGFISASLHRSIDGTKVALYGQWESDEHYQRYVSMRSNPSASGYVEEILAIARFDPGVYAVVKVFSGPSNAPSADISGVPLMPSEFTRVKPVSIPAQSSIATVYESTNLADAFAVRLPTGTSADPAVLWRFVMSHQPSWVRWLTGVRDVVVACFGLKTAKHLATFSEGTNGERLAFFKVYGKSESEIILGEDDKHLDFRLSVLRSSDVSPTLGGQLTVATVVHCHNLLGRAYLFVIAPFHRLVVKASLRRAAYLGWPKAGG